MRGKGGKYLTWVRGQPCCACGADGGVDPHHIKVTGLHLGGVGMTAPDLFAIPLCRGHHDELHRDIAAWERKYGSQCEHLVRTQYRALKAGRIES